MDNEILYIFSSALRPVYRDNIAKIISLPINYTTEFGYTLNQNVPPNLINRIRFKSSRPDQFKTFLPYQINTYREDLLTSLWTIVIADDRE